MFCARLELWPLMPQTCKVNNNNNDNNDSWKKESGKIGSGREPLHLPAPRKSNPVNEAAMEVDLWGGRQEGREEGGEKKEGD